MRLFLFIILTLCRTGALCAGQEAGLQDYYCKETKKPFFAEAGEKGRFEAQRSQAYPESFVMPKPAGTKRVFIIGESVATLLGPGKDLPGTKPAGEKLLDKLLGTGAPKDGQEIEIINCGMGGYESFRIYGVLKEILRYSPDLVVILSGNNDTREESCPGLECDLRRRKFRLLEKYYSINGSAPEARKKALFKMHAGMLAKMAGAAKKAGVPALFCTLPAAVRDMPPGQITAVPDMPPGWSAPLEKPGFASGYRLFYAKKYAEALAEFKKGLAADPREPYFNFYAAKSLDRLGRDKEAASYYFNAINFDAVMSRSGRERNDLIRRTAAAEGACVADLEKLFLGLSAAGLPGFTEFTDAMHWNRPYTKSVWEEIFRAAGRCGIKGFGEFTAGGPKQWTETSRETALKRLAYAFAWLDEKTMNEASLAELSRIKADQPELLKKAGASPEQFRNLLPDNLWSAEKNKRVKELFPFFLAHLAETERRAGNNSRALELCEKALLLKPEDTLLKLERIQILADLGGKPEKELLALTTSGPLSKTAAALAAAYGYLSPAIPASAAKPAAPAAKPASRENAVLSKELSDQAVKKIFVNDLKAAEGLSLKALEKNPYNPEALMTLCSLRQKAGQKTQALEACRRAASSFYLDPANKIPPYELLSCDAAFESYKLLKELKRETEAVQVLDQCVKRAPAYWPGLDAARATLKLDNRVKKTAENQ
jgi:Flp pilus assembly protein TadD